MVFPAECELRFHFQPPQPFGLEASGGRTCVRAVEATAIFNRNTGQSTIKSVTPLSPLEVIIESPDTLTSLEGTTLAIRRTFASPDEVREWTESIYFGLPALLNVPFADPPFIERVDGTLAGHSFRWELAAWRMQWRPTTQEKQESAFATAWERMALLGMPGRRRLLAALHYFHVACRLARAGETIGEFMAEVILNLAKTLEALFPPKSGGQSRDSVRRGLKSLGYSEDDIEASFVPAMALRNEIDVGHVQLGLFRPDQLAAIHAYTERAEGEFRSMLDKLLVAVESGELEIPHHELGPPSKDALGVVSRLRDAMLQDPGWQAFQPDTPERA